MWCRIVTSGNRRGCLSSVFLYAFFGVFLVCFSPASANAITQCQKDSLTRHLLDRNTMALREILSVSRRVVVDHTINSEVNVGRAKENMNAEDTPGGYHSAAVAYATILSAMTYKDKNTAKKIVKAALSELADIEELRSSDDHALRSLLLGQKIRLSPWRAVFLGGKLKKEADIATQLDALLREEATKLQGEGAIPHPTETHPKTSALVHYTQASYLHFMPSSFGGDIDKALSLYQTIIAQGVGAQRECWVLSAAITEVYMAMQKIEKKKSFLRRGEKYNSAAKVTAVKQQMRSYLPSSRWWEYLDENYQQ